MKKEIKKTKSWWTGVVGLVITLLGIYLAIKAFLGVYHKLEENSNQRLMDIAWSVDWNLSMALTHTKADLEYFLSSCEDMEEAFLSGENGEALISYFKSFPLINTGLVSSVIGIDGEKTVFSTDGRAEEYEFPFGCVTNKPCLCTRGDKNYLAIVRSSGKTPLKYGVLLDLERLYIHIGGATITQDYWLVLYDTGTELLLQNKTNYPLVEKRSPDELKEKPEGVGCLVRNELNGSSAINTYSWLYGDETKEEIQVNIATLSTNINRNGVFAVGVGIDSGIMKGVIDDFLISIIVSCLLALGGLFALIMILFRNRRAANEMREKTRRLEAENANMQKLIELSHLQRLELIGTMTSGIAHEFNNLLTPIMSYSILTMEKLPEESSELMDNLSEIYEASRRAKALIRETSGLSQKSSMNRSLCSPDELVKKVLGTAMPSKPESVALQTELHCPEAYLFVNETQMSQLLLNLILNAYQAMENSGSLLRISTREENGSAVFRVSDNGPGIEAELLDKIFEPFFTTKESGHGTGLGLSIAARIAEEYNGKIEVKSVLGIGTEFKVNVPITVKDVKNTGKM